jgi:hypothetical protein
MIHFIVLWNFSKDTLSQVYHDLQPVAVYSYFVRFRVSPPVRGELVEPQGTFDRLRANGGRII